MQPRDDLWEAIYQITALQYGDETARETIEGLRADPVLSTSNHLGLDTLAESVQGTLLYALRPSPRGESRGIAVVLGCGSVSMDSVTYPRGLLLYDCKSSQIL
jgi:hypothetical protein